MRPRLHRSGDPATNPHSGLRELTVTHCPPLGLLPSGVAASGSAAAFSVSSPIFGSNAECAFSILVFDKTRVPLHHSAFCAPASDLSDPCGLPPAPARLAATPRVTLTRATLPAALPQALHAPTWTVTDALVCCFRKSRLPPFHSFSPSRIIIGAWNALAASAAPVRRSRHQPLLRHAGTNSYSLPSLGPSAQRRRRERLRSRVFSFQPNFRVQCRVRIPSPPFRSCSLLQCVSWSLPNRLARIRRG
jgi:hypothetical protein